MKSASNSDINNIVYTNNSEDVAIEMANLDLHNIINSGPLILKSLLLILITMLCAYT